MLGLGSHAAHIERTKVIRQFKDLFGTPVTELSKVCWENFSLRVLLESQFPRRLSDVFSFSQANNLPLWHLVLSFLFLIRNFKMHVRIGKAESD